MPGGYLHAKDPIHAVYHLCRLPFFLAGLPHRRLYTLTIALEAGPVVRRFAGNDFLDTACRFGRSLGCGFEIQNKHLQPVPSSR